VFEKQSTEEAVLMNQDVIAGKWKQMRGEVKQWWGKLTDDDLDRVNGAMDKLAACCKSATAGSASGRSARSSSASRASSEDARDASRR
jgi:uncharacterized protein YjbJ (UPF0337 family)